MRAKTWYAKYMMKKELSSYWVNRANPLIWIAALLMSISGALRLVYFVLKDDVGGWVWAFQAVLPAFGALLFALLLIFCGKEALYKTITPLTLGAFGFFVQGLGMRGAFSWMCCLYCVLLVMIYTQTLQGRIHTKLLLLPLYALPMAYLATLLFLHWQGFKKWETCAGELSALGMLCALFLTAVAMKIDTSGLRRRRWGDRNDGRLVRTMTPMAYVSPYIMVHRNGSSNFIADTVEITEIEKYIREKRKSGMKGFGLMHVLIAAYVRTVAQMPGINRFVSGQKIYTRDGHIEVNLTVKKEMTAKASDTVIKVEFTPWDTPEQVYARMSQKIEEVKNTPLDSNFDRLAQIINVIPGIFLKFVVWLLKTLDYFGLLPRILTKLSPFHGSFFITSMGSLGIPPIYHHLYDFGNVPIFCSFGAKYTKYESVGGEPAVRKYMDYTFVTDERICDGFYFAAALKNIRRLLAHPAKLDEPPKKIVSDID